MNIAQFNGLKDCLKPGDKFYFIIRRKLTRTTVISVFAVWNSELIDITLEVSRALNLKYQNNFTPELIIGNPGYTAGEYLKDGLIEHLAFSKESLEAKEL